MAEMPPRRDPAPLVEGETVELEDAAPGETEVAGGVLVALDDEAAVERNPEHYANIADDIDKARPGYLKGFATELLELIERDKKSREKRDEQYAEGIRRTGLGNDAPGGAQFEGASRVVHPVLTEAAVDFESRVIKELFPAKGPAKSHIPGKATRDKVQKAERKAKHLNWQLTKQMEEFRAELEQLLTQLPLGGSQFMKLGWDAARKRPTAIFVPVDEIYLPFVATNYYTAERKTHKQEITEQEFLRRKKSGMYRDVELPAPPAEGEQSTAEKASDKVEGKTPDPYNSDGLRTVFETCLCADLEKEDDTAPYVTTVDEWSGEVLAVYRNWRQDDAQKIELIWAIEFQFVPWRGAYGIGLLHMIGGLSGAATGALRALLDAAHIQNFPGGLKLKGGGKGGGNERVAPTEIKDIEGTLTQDDIRKLFMAFPFNPPSATLFQLLGFVVEAAKGVVRTTFENLADQKTDMPVGTTLALIEQGMTVFSAIHGRLHDSMRRLLHVICRINDMYLEDDDLKDEAGELLAKRADYAGPEDVVPVSDPNIFSETQRFAQTQAVVARSDAHPELYDQRAVETMLLERLRIPDFERLMRKAPEPKPMNAVNENIAATSGHPIVAFPRQDHLAHIQAHVEFMQSPLLGSFVLLAPTALPALLNHLKEHIIFWYVTSVYETVSEAAGRPAEELIDQDPETSVLYDRLLAAASGRVVAGAAEVFKELPPPVMAAIELAKQFAPPQLLDPSQVAAQESQRRGAADQMKAQLSAEDLKAKIERDRQQLKLDEAELTLKKQQAAAGAAGAEQQTQADLLVEAAELQDRDRSRLFAADQAERDRQVELAAEAQENARKAAELAARERINEADNQTARDLAAAEIASGERVAVSTGTGLDKNP